MGKKKADGEEGEPKTKTKEEEEGRKEGQNLLGKPTFKKLENGRFRCVQTGHELPAKDRESYAKTKHCRLGLIDSALARGKPPLNMFDQDPLCRSKLICKLTGITVNKTEEHIWKHINGKRFLSMLEKKEKETEEQMTYEVVREDSEQKPGKETEEQMTYEVVKEDSEKKPDKMSKRKRNGSKKKKEKVEEEEEENVDGLNSDSEEDYFWIPPVGDRWDLDKGGDRWGSDSESGPETDDDGNGLDGVCDGDGEESDNDEGEPSKRTKKMAVEIGESDLPSRKKKNKKKKKRKKAKSTP